MRQKRRKCKTIRHARDTGIQPVALSNQASGDFKYIHSANKKLGKSPKSTNQLKNAVNKKSLVSTR
ncbi:MAG: hypothetical protein AAGI66_02630 [Cyanobacteria bacterium P01_H01_bin.74]